MSVIVLIMENQAITLHTPNALTHERIIAGWQVSLGESLNTLRAYTRNLGAYCAWLDAQGLDLLAAKRMEVDGYRHSLTDKPATVAQKLATVSAFYRYAISQDVIAINPAAGVKRPAISPDHTNTQGLNKDQAKAMLATAKADSPRSYALVCVLLFTGVRIGEALNATTADYGHDKGYRVLMIRRKGGKGDSVVVPPPAVAALNAYLETDGRELAAGKAGAGLPIFTTSTGKPWAQSGAFNTIKRLAKAAGIAGKISPHSLRHTFATLALDAGATLHDLQDSMGHADPRTTQRYNHARNRPERSASNDVAKALA